MTVYVAFDGGASYSREDRATAYPSLRAAAAEYRSRFGDSFYPCWGDPSVYSICEDGCHYAGLAWTTTPQPDDCDCGCDPLDTADAYPDYCLVVGPRGGLRWEPC